jgi:hypothetical protein
MRTGIVALLLALAVSAAVPATQPLAKPSPAPVAAVVAHKCSKGYTHAVIGNEHKVPAARSVLREALPSAVQAVRLHMRA